MSINYFGKIYILEDDGKLRQSKYVTPFIVKSDYSSLCARIRQTALHELLSDFKLGSKYIENKGLYEFVAARENYRLGSASETLSSSELFKVSCVDVSTMSKLFSINIMFIGDKEVTNNVDNTNTRELNGENSKIKYTPGLINVLSCINKRIVEVMNSSDNAEEDETLNVRNTEKNTEKNELDIEMYRNRQKRIFDNKVNHGFNTTNVYQEARYILEETAELMRAIEKGDMENIKEELADIVIFAYGCAEVAGVGDLDSKIFHKMKINEKRVYTRNSEGDFIKKQ